jgi:2-succinyl-6-hydroxy-2,4-cyclohexadiene-1-carboxylate synthase
MLVLLHGFTHTGASWDPVVAGLGERYRVLAPDIRGHGSASARRPVTLGAVVSDLRGLVGQERLTLAGYSMGGRIALHAALALAPAVGRLVLIGASPGIASDDEREARRVADERLAGELEAISIEQFAEQWAGSTEVLAGQPPAVAAAAHADRLRNTPAGLAAALRGLGTGALPPLWERLEELTIPVTLIAGERDQKFSEIAAQMARALPDGSVQIVSGVGHAVHLEAPARVAAALVT